MKRVLPLSLLAVLIALPASAQVEPWMSGDWQAPANGGEPAKSWHIEPDGRYRTMLNGRQVDSGTLSAKGSTWNLRSDTGQAQSGNFSSIGGNLKMSGNISGSWTRTGSSTGASGGNAAHSSFPGFARGSSSPGFPSLPSSSSNPSNPSFPSFPTSSNSSGNPNNFSNPANSNTAGNPGNSGNFSNPGFSPNPGAPHIPPSQSYSSMFGHGKRPDLPGYTAPSQPRHRADNSHPNYGLSSANLDTGKIQIKDVSAEEYEAYRTRPVGDPNPAKHIDAHGHYKYTVEEQLKDHPQGVVYRVNGNDIMRMHNARQQSKAPQRDTFAENEKFQQMFRGMTGPRPVPRGGYIPVMKDGKARRFFGGY